MRTRCSIPIVLLAGSLANACGDAPPRSSHGAVDSPAAIVTRDDEIGATNPGWDTAAGPVLLVAGERPDQAIVIAPGRAGTASAAAVDLTAITGREAVLLGRRGLIAAAQTAHDTAGVPVPGCNDWPLVSLPAGTPRWTAGFLSSRVMALPLDSIHGAPRRDSSLAVAQVARLASGLGATGGGEEANFRGLPFTVQDMRRLSLDSVGVLIAHVIRRVNQEASPAEEHTLLIAERARPDGEWQAVHAIRTAGPEDSVARHELLAAARIGATPALIFVRDGGSELHYLMLRREAGGWRTAWTSAVSRC